MVRIAISLAPKRDRHDADPAYRLLAEIERRESIGTWRNRPNANRCNLRLMYLLSVRYTPLLYFYRLDLTLRVRVRACLRLLSVFARERARQKRPDIAGISREQQQKPGIVAG